MKKTFLLAFVALIMLYACSDDEKNVYEPQKETKNYMPLQAGNYWIYDVYDAPYNGSEKLIFKDTLIVVEETKTIRGKKFYILEERKGKTNFTLQFNNCITTDSLGYIVTDKGNAIFSNINFTDTIYNIHVEAPTNSSMPYYVSGKMKKISTPYIVPAGSFSNVLDFERCVYIPSIPINNESIGSNPKFTHTYYVKGVGIIYHTTVYLMSGESIKWRLAKYHINGKTYPQ